MIFVLGATATARLPALHKIHIVAKSSDLSQRVANFLFLDFGAPLEKSVSLTFSEQWLCHFSQGVFRWKFR